MIINDAGAIINSIKQGKIVCFKTDTIWGFSVDGEDENAIKNLSKIKNREPSKPFIFLIKENEDLTKIVKTISPCAKKLMSAFWPGPLTIVFEAQDNLPILKTFNNIKTIALRMPNNMLCQNILKSLTTPLPSTSVNVEGTPALNNYFDICKNFNTEDICIFPNFEESFSKENPVSSTIISCVDNKPTILREGTISKQEILNILNN